jgi:hypothetical protein
VLYYCSEIVLLSYGVVLWRFIMCDSVAVALLCHCAIMLSCDSGVAALL